MTKNLFIMSLKIENMRFIQDEMLYFQAKKHGQ